MLNAPELAAAAAGVRLDAMRPQPFAVRRLTRETHDSFTLTLAPALEAASFAFEPGQFNMLYAFGAGEVPISISGDPGRPERLVHTIRAVGAATRALKGLKRGDWVGVRGPFGSAWPVQQAHGHDVVIVTGGIGLAPLRPALYYVLAHRGQYGRVVLLYGARTPKDLLYPRELKQWRSRFDLEVHVTVDRASTDWQGGVGVVTKLIARAGFEPQSTLAFVCGPEVMMRYAVMGLQQRGLPEDSIFVSLERNMKCAVGFCGHCQLGPLFICRDGPVLRYDRVAELLARREV